MTRKFQLPADLSYEAVMARDLLIPNPNGEETFLDVANTGDSELVHVLLGEAERAGARTLVRDAGGCKGRIKELMPTLFGYYANGSLIDVDGIPHGFAGFRFSGGTDIGAVVNVPAYLARLFPCISGSTTPRTARMTLRSAGGVTVDNYATALDAGQHSATVVQENVKDVLDWNGDVRAYIAFMKIALRHGFKGAVTVCNGGGVTLDEALLAWLSGIPVILIKGTERAADELVDAFEDGTLAAKFDDSFNDDDRLLDSEVDNHDAVDSIDFNALTRVATFDENLDDLGASTFARAQYDLGLLTPLS